MATTRADRYAGVPCMNPPLVLISLLGTTFAWVAIPLVPMFREISRPRDATALEGVSRGPLAELGGSVDAAELIADLVTIPAGTRFTLARARTIVAGAPAATDSTAAARSAPVVTMRIGEAHQLATGTRRIARDLRVAPGHRVDGSVIVAGNVILGAGAEVSGSIKAHGVITLGAMSRVRGTVVSSTSVAIESGARVTGSVLAERTIELGAGVTVGAPDAPASVSGVRVTLHAGCTVHGSIFARDHADVL